MVVRVGRCHMDSKGEGLDTGGGMWVGGMVGCDNKAYSTTRNLIVKTHKLIKSALCTFRWSL